MTLKRHEKAAELVTECLPIKSETKTAGKPPYGQTFADTHTYKLFLGHRPATLPP